VSVTADALEDQSMLLRVIRSTGRVRRPVMRPLASTLGAVALLAAAAIPALASAPSVTDQSLTRDTPFIDCPSGSTLWGRWSVERTITVWSDASGTPIRDHFVIRFEGVIYNHATGASVADSGTNDFKDELTPDGSFASTVWVYQRSNVYLHEAGQRLLGPSDANGDQATLRQVGMSHFESGVPAICSALGA
jgi:hypothetical protein